MKYFGTLQGCDLCRYGDIYPLEFAMCNKYYQVAELIIRNGCKISSKTWLGSQMEPLNNRHGDVVRLARSFMSTDSVRSLKHISRKALRSHIKQGVLFKMGQLDLPQSLKDYVCFKY